MLEPDRQESHVLRTGADAAEAVRLLREGRVVAVPTETVYGLGADASNPDAVAKVFALKGRPADHPLIVHIGDVDELSWWARDIPEAALTLARRFWPGPLTVILKRGPHVLDAVTGGQDTVGIRVPDHPLTLRLLAEFGGGVAAPSANRFGRVSPTSAQHVEAEFGDAVDYILDGGPCGVGLESTIVDFSGTAPRILRPGAVTADDVASVLGEAALVAVHASEAPSPRVPGTLASHYAPDATVRLLPFDGIAKALASAVRQGCKVGVMARAVAPDDGLPSMCRWVHMSEEPGGYGRELYAALRDLDVSDCDVILVETPPSASEWEAVRDRLARAAAGTSPEDENLGT